MDRGGEQCDVSYACGQWLGLQGRLFMDIPSDLPSDRRSSPVCGNRDRTLIHLLTECDAAEAARRKCDLQESTARWILEFADEVDVSYMKVITLLWQPCSNVLLRIGEG